MSYEIGMSADLGGIYMVVLENYSISCSYNLSGLLKEAFQDTTEEGLKWLNGKRGGDCISPLNLALEFISKKTFGENIDNVGYLKVTGLLFTLSSWAKEAPNAVFVIS